MTKSPAWMDLEDALRKLDQQLVQNVFQKNCTVEEADMARNVIDVVLSLPTVAENVGDQSRKWLQSDLPGEGLQDESVEMY